MKDGSWFIFSTRSALISLICTLTAASCAPVRDTGSAAELLGYWTHEDLVLEVRGGGAMILTAQKMFEHEGLSYPVLFVPGPAGGREAIELKKCDPRVCLTDIRTLETFEFEGSWRSIETALVSEEFGFKLIDASHVRIERASAYESSTPLDIAGAAAYEISGNLLELRFTDQRKYEFRRGCAAVWCGAAQE